MTPIRIASFACLLVIHAVQLSTPASAGVPFPLPLTHSVPKKQAMIRIYPQPDTVTAAWARHKKAYYDGINPIPYRIPVGVSFGRYPYHFELDEPLPGMTIGADYGDPNYGVVTWTPTAPATNAIVTVRVTDQDGDTLIVDWTVSTSSTAFVFVSSSAPPNGLGTISSPLQTLADAFGGTYNTAKNAGKICYLRSGTYELPQYADNTIGIPNWSCFELDNSRKPSALIGYPGDTAPVLNGSSGVCRANGKAGDFFMQDLRISGYKSSEANYVFLGIKTPADSRGTFDGIAWTGAGFGSAGDSPSTLFFTPDQNGPNRIRHLYIRNCSESGRTKSLNDNSYALQCFYSTQFTLTELCKVTGSANTALYLKGTNEDACLRGNDLSGLSGSDRACSTGFQNPKRIEVCYNKMNAGIVTAGTQATGSVYGAHWFYRNSIKGQIGAYTPSINGPYVFENNAVVSDSGIVRPFDGAGYGTGAQLTNSGTACQGGTSLGILDGSFNLAGAYRTQNLGKVGAEIAATAGLAGPEANVTGNSVGIVDGDATPSTSDKTDFGNVNVASGSVTNTYTIQNTGTAVLTVGSVAISGSHAADFAVTAQPAASVAVGSSTTFSVKFDPSAAGPRSASLSFGTNDTDENPYNFSIQGTGGSSSGDIIVDNADASGVALLPNAAAWAVSTNMTGYHGANYLHDFNTGGGKSARFTPVIPTEGIYEVFTRWIAYTNRASNVPIDIVTAGGTVPVQVDQRSNGGTWVSLRSYPFNAGSGGSVLISNTGANGYVIADAVKFTPLVLNPGFEVDAAGSQTITGWSESGSNPTASLTSSSITAHGGTRYLAHTLGSAYNVFTSQTRTGLPNGSYTLKAWVQRTNAPNGQTQTTAQMEASGFGGSTLTATIPVTSTWTQITISGINVTNGTCTFGFRSNSPASANIRVDDVQFYRP